MSTSESIEMNALIPRASPITPKSNIKHLKRYTNQYEFAFRVYEDNQRSSNSNSKLFHRVLM